MRVAVEVGWWEGDGASKLPDATFHFSFLEDRSAHLLNINLPSSRLNIVVHSIIATVVPEFLNFGLL